MNVTRDEDGKFYVIDANGDNIAGPFDNEKDAWDAMDELPDERDKFDYHHPVAE